LSTPVFSVDPNDFSPDALSEPARILASGGLVGFPTETVYGIAARADDAEAVARLKRLKDRPDQKPFSIHLADKEDLEQQVPGAPESVAALIEFFWPGPLTLVLPTEEGTTGFRLPSHPVARALIRQSGVPVIAPSANPAGEEPALNAESVLRYFDGQLDAVIDSGEVVIREASTVVKLDHENRCEVLREGIITEKMIHRVLFGRRVLFVCTGNSCRSPMAMALTRHLLAERLGVSSEELPQKGIHVESAGIAAFDGGRASENAIEAMAERGIDLSNHRSQPVSREMIESADLVIALGHGHRDQLLHWNPSLVDRVVVISETGVSDPIGGDCEIYRRCALEIERDLQARWLERIEEL